MALKKLFLFWLKNARYHALPQSVIPACLAACLAFGQEGFHLFYAVLAVLGTSLGHLGINLFDDFFDYLKKETIFRNKMALQGMRARIGKCPYLISNQATLKQLLCACCLFSGLALCIALIIYFKRGNAILIFAGVTAFLGLFYSAWPFRLSYHGLGEMTVGVIFGPLLMSGVYYAACGQFAPSLLFISIPIGLFVTNILYVHSILDYEPDKNVGKRTLAVLLDNKRLMLAALLVFTLSPYLIICVGIYAGFLSKYFFFVFVTLPMALELFRLMWLYTKDSKRDIQRKFWMGPMNNWDRIISNRIEWFMIRWYIARNLLVFFCVIVFLASICG